FSGSTKLGDSLVKRAEAILQFGELWSLLPTRLRQSLAEVFSHRVKKLFVKLGLSDFEISRAQFFEARRPAREREQFFEALLSVLIHRAECKEHILVNGPCGGVEIRLEGVSEFARFSQFRSLELRFGLVNEWLSRLLQSIPFFFHCVSRQAIYFGKLLKQASGSNCSTWTIYDRFDVLEPIRLGIGQILLVSC